MTENAGIKRRTVLKGAAWSVPVVAAAVATPFAAASVTLEGVGNTLSQNCGKYRLDVWPEDSNFGKLPMTGATVTFVLEGDLSSLNPTFSGLSITGDDHGSPRTITGTATADTVSILGDQQGNFTSSVKISFPSGPNAGKSVSANFGIGPQYVSGCNPSRNVVKSSSKVGGGSGNGWREAQTTFSIANAIGSGVSLQNATIWIEFLDSEEFRNVTSVTGGTWTGRAGTRIYDLSGNTANEVKFTAEYKAVTTARVKINVKLAGSNAVVSVIETITGL
ncbi:MAG: hypothetical protein JSS74_02845 [Actinobacteria bacterium]|nr:hypothetical protein [Actinomycetota bacterium]